MQFWTNISLLRSGKGLSWEALAQELGLGPDRAAAWAEQGALLPEEILLMANYFQVSPERLLTEEVSAIHRPDIRLLILDVDGVMTDGGMYVSESGDETKRFHTRDGRGIIEVQKQGVQVGIISGSFVRKAVEKRAQTLKIARVYIGPEEKTEVLRSWMDEMGIGPEQVAFIGDDLNDLGMMAMAGLTACPADACATIRSRANIVLRKPGGAGCVREFIDMFWDL